ncbi:SRPBCC family protein [Steroidobacter sp. S1-65]|uniref:SRPBCC family protein n=1 Tax=Steroidobacter gossypii TaxID=2805490 RepID=A0ABS1X1S2_9GAMM|nr:SRPBCC family protein [Steroidobacter gossypii]MBM0107175.1 SRPBCC family protein [Steroidobacter gossypii]
MAASFAPRPTLDRSLGWFSLGLGVAELLAPKTVGRMIGVGDQSTMLRMCGMREIVSGVGLLSGRAPATFAMSRVVGDVMDLALLGASLRSPDANPTRVAAAATAVAGVAALDLYASKADLQSSLAEAPQDVPVTTSLTVNSPPEEVYQFWRKLENLPRFMTYLDSVRQVDERTSEWVARAPGGVKLQWRSEIVEDEPNRFISWRTCPGSEINHVGSVRFESAPNGRGTILRVEMYYGLPGGPMAARVGQLISNGPEAMVLEDLRRLKQLIETGEIATTRGQPSGARSLVGRAFSRGES